MKIEINEETQTATVQMNSREYDLFKALFYQQLNDGFWKKKVIKAYFNMFGNKLLLEIFNSGVLANDFLPF